MSNSLLGFTSDTSLSQVQWGAPKKNETTARIFVTGRSHPLKEKDLGALPIAWQSKQEYQSALVQKYATEQGPLWVVQIDPPVSPQHYGQFEMTPYTMARDTLGAVVRETSQFENLNIKYFGSSAEEFKGIVVGLEVSQYRFKNQWPKAIGKKQKIYFEAPSLKDCKLIFAEGKALGEAMNLARHLVNLPGNVLNPSSYAQFAKDVFKNLKVKTEVWDYSQLTKENMGLLAGVGQASPDKPCLIKISYRATASKSHYAFVGKGITFDTGGLDIKPASGMRDMKKDMGGSASVIGLAYWMAKTRPKINADFYLAVAENSVNENAFRPGDILQSRSGKTVEIHNTDAEGRLVLADALALAAEAKPQFIIDVATLTGAIKVAIGETTAGLFSNDDKLAATILKSAQQTGDNCWRIPLDPTQKHKLRTDVADLVNAHEGFGGAVTAALFLEAFVNNIPWAHFDIYSWTGSASGAFSEKGGTGQVVQCLAHVCEGLSSVFEK